MVIAIIDDGVSPYSIPNLLFSLHVDECGLVCTFKEYIDSTSHGSICASIIQKYTPNAQIGSIKILDNETKKGDCDKLEKAIYWCINNNVKIIHLSLGTISASDHSSLLKAVNDAYKYGIIIISACKNGSHSSYPASFSNVIGVQCDRKLKDNSYYAHSPNFHGIDFFASASHEIKELKSTPYQGITPICNSYAAPVITAKVYEILENFPSMTLDQIKDGLNKSSKIFIPLYQPFLYKQTDWIDSVKILSIGNFPISLNSIYYWKIKDVTFLDTESEIRNILNSTLGTEPIALYNIHTSNVESMITENIHPLIFFNRVNTAALKNYTKRIFVPTIIDDYATKKIVNNERPIIAVIQSLNISTQPVYALLNKMFEQKDFHTLLFSEFSIDILLGAVYIDNAQLYQYSCINMATQLNTELLIVHSCLENLQTLNPDIILCNSSLVNLINQKDTRNTNIISIENYSINELFEIICSIICE